MPRGRSETDYELPRTTTTGARRPRLSENHLDAGAQVWPDKPGVDAADLAPSADDAPPTPTPPAAGKKIAATFLRRGHSLTYVALFVFTVILYARPAEFYPSPWTASIAFILGAVTLAFFLPSQLALEGTLTARPREVSLVLLFCLTGLLSIPLALSPGTAWETFSDTFIRCVFIFIVMVNVVRTEARLKGMLFLTLLVSIWLSVGAINDYRLGLMTVEGYRVGGRGSGIFGNSNDMALHLVTILPITIALLLGARRLFGKIFYGACGALLIAAIVLTYSRGAFIALMVAFGFMAFKIGRGHRLGVLLLAFLVIAGLLLFAPGNYGRRIISIFVPSLDPVGSADARRGELIRSLHVAARHPLFGIGMGNYATQMSYRGLVTHNSYTQVAAEMGAAALVLYTLFILTPLRRLGQMARETFGSRKSSRHYYLAVGLQTSLLAYMVASFFASVSYQWYVYYLVGYAVCLRRLYESEKGSAIVPEKKQAKEEERRRRTALARPGVRAETV
ncbi:MAG TPA: O-antigen ligase family protein [Pyrinomonadaceae bacterium]|nr:O-antigen ligase family protein [Pyrinomonadaceae bacterium]